MMSRLVDFAKLEATGNDFIFFDKSNIGSDELSVDNIKKMCNRHTGIGADGIVMVSNGQAQRLKIKYFNADGSRGGMCGNALRATVLFGFMHGKIKMKSKRKIEADDGEHDIYMDSPDDIQVEIKVKNPIKDIPDKDLNLTDNLKSIGFINTGVPHLVINSKSDLNKLDVFDLGKSIRWHRLFQPAGTNVNFIKEDGDNQLQVRTYERGVENETLSCGTGVIASVLAYWNMKKLDPSKVEVSTLGGKLYVYYRDNILILNGPARTAFIGQYLIV